MLEDRHEVVVAAGGHIHHKDTKGWKTSLTGEFWHTLYTIWGDASGVLYAGGGEVGNGYLLRNSGSGWKTFTPNGTGIGNVPTILAVTGVAGKIYAVGKGGHAYIYDSGKWTGGQAVNKNDLWGIWAVDKSNIFAVGDNGTAARHNGKAWASVSTNKITQNLKGVWGSGPKDVWAVGHGGTVLRFTSMAGGFKLQTVPTGFTAHLNAVWGTSGQNIIAAGNGGLGLLYGSSKWKQVTLPASGNIRSISGGSSGEIFAAGEKGALLRFNGSNWNKAYPPTGQHLFGVWSSVKHGTWAVGEHAAVLRKCP